MRCKSCASEMVTVKGTVVSRRSVAKQRHAARSQRSPSSVGRRSGEVLPAAVPPKFVTAKALWMCNSRGFPGASSQPRSEYSCTSKEILRQCLGRKCRPASIPTALPEHMSSGHLCRCNIVAMVSKRAPNTLNPMSLRIASRWQKATKCPVRRITRQWESGPISSFRYGVNQDLARSSQSTQSTGCVAR